jgi:hypothetical protein
MELINYNKIEHFSLTLMAKEVDKIVGTFDYQMENLASNKELIVNYSNNNLTISYEKYKKIIQIVNVEFNKQFQWHELEMLNELFNHYKK